MPSSSPAAPVDLVNPGGDPSILLLCDHATNHVPDAYGGLGLPPGEFERHIAYDVGARGVVTGLARRLGCPAVMSRFSRLLIDPNRGEDDPTLIMRLSDGAVVPGNRSVDAAERERRLDTWYRPYHRAIDAALDRALAQGVDPVIYSIHSFTPAMRKGPPRPWHVAVLWSNRDARVARPLLSRLAATGRWTVGDNEPYTGDLEGDCLWQHGVRRGIHHALIEVRNDLIADPAGQDAWAEDLAPILSDVARTAAGRAMALGSAAS